MAINEQKERMVLNQSPERLVLAVENGQITLDELADIAVRKPIFAPRYEIVRQQIESRPNPKETSDFEDIASRYARGEKSEALLSLMDSYIGRWRSNAVAAEHVAQVEQWRAVVKEAIDFERLEHRVPNDIKAYNDSRIVPSVEVLQALKMYLDEWRRNNTPASDQHLEIVSGWFAAVEDMRHQKTAGEWDALFERADFSASRRLRSIDALKAFAEEYGSDPEYRDRIDEEYWRWVLTQPDVISAAGEYNNYFHNVGIHSSDVAGLSELKRKWDEVDNSDIFEVISYIENNESSPFVCEARNTLNLLKIDELDLMRREPGVYSDAKFRRLYYSNACSREELLDAIGNNEEVFDRILNLDTARTTVLGIPDPAEQEFSRGGVGQTDIVFFGMPSSGKTCVLTGLFASQRLSPDTADWNGRYALALQSFGEAMIAPPRTKTQFVAVVKCEIYKTAGKKELKVPFNLVDMAGEDFQSQIIQSGYSDAEVNISFASMGEGAPEILANDNDKVFFVLIDPTATGSRDTIQRNAIRTLVGLFMNQSNREVMRRVRGLHFIVTKADTLQGNRLEAAHRSVHDILNDATCTKITRFCRDLGINFSSDDKLNGRPRVLCFSLGKFYPGNIFAGPQRDTDTILNIISDYVVAERYDSIPRKVRRFFTQPLF